MNKDLDFSKMRVLSKEESEKLTMTFNNYYKDLNSGLNDILKSKGMEKEKITYSAMTTPIPSVERFSYNRGELDIDAEIKKLIDELRTKHYPE